MKVLQFIFKVMFFILFFWAVVLYKLVKAYR
jgi:hypothetical protein